MISCLLIHVTSNKKGLSASHEFRVTGEELLLGRSALCQIHLPDHRVGLRHARICHSADGALRIEAENDEVMSVNGFLERASELAPGSRITLGPYLLTVKPPVDGADLVLSLEMPAGSAEEDEVLRKKPVTLAALGISKRKIGVWLAILVLGGEFLWPLMTRVSPGLEKWQAGLPIAVTWLLNPGPLSGGHSVFGMECSSCHEQVFQPVADTACTKCHERMMVHLAPDNQRAGKLREARCADCHAGHEGKAEAMKLGLTRCVKCHKTINTEISKVRDFESRHPLFHYDVPQGKRTVRVREDEGVMPPEDSGLKFSHKTHLVKGGVSSPLGDTVLGCRDCHKLDEGGMHFAPTNMEQTCQQSRCHRQRFPEPVGGFAPHGSERAVMERLRGFYTSWLAAAPERGARECASVKGSLNAVERTLECADELARKLAAATLFRKSGKDLECVLCHMIEETNDKEFPWKVAPVRARHDWQAKSVFPHTRHETIDCSDCHDKRESTRSEDVSFPTLGKCRECHGGASPAAGKVRSSCESCHRYHRVAVSPSEQGESPSR
jgi:hypothetical protein